MRLGFAFALISVILASCSNDKEKKESVELPGKLINVPEFNGDSAYFFVKKQVDFGPRVPNTRSHRLAGDYFISQLKKYAASVTIQEFEATTFDGQKLNLRNIIATYFPQKQKRILLAAHWDTRPFADKDSLKKDAPFDGANDGASGVGVLLEIARHLGQDSIKPNVGIDIILFDGEDWGEKESQQNQVGPPDELDSWWCLGSQYWAKNKHKPNYSAYYGILLDMVGAKDAHFFREGISLQYAPRIVDRVWNAASRLGYSQYFVRQNAGEITDDHKYVNLDANIPMIDIVHYDPQTGYFGDFHHTRKDNLSLISEKTLNAVGEVLMNVIYYEE